MKRVLLALALGGAALSAGRPDGRWITASGNVVVEIAPCGARLCGVVIKVLANHSMVDPSKTLARPATVGLNILTDLSPAGDGVWKGRIYNRENGKTYDCLVRPDGEALNVRPFIGLPLLGKAQTWTRAVRD
ncbi:MAG TPA: DUF2147 domain-containing protein [Caulobacteraceae bacterium]